MDINKPITEKKCIRYLIWLALMLIVMVTWIQVGKNTKVSDNGKDSLAWCGDRLYKDELVEAFLLQDTTANIISDYFEDYQKSTATLPALSTLAYAMLYGVNTEQDINLALSILDRIATSRGNKDMILLALQESSFTRQLCSNKQNNQDLRQNFKYLSSQGIAIGAYYDFLYSLDDVQDVDFKAFKRFSESNYVEFLPAILELYYQFYRNDSWQSNFRVQLFNLKVFNSCKHSQLFIDPNVFGEEGINSRKVFIKEVNKAHFKQCFN